jgi:hypothetical protein
MCRKKKIKCDGKMPACTHCINYKTDCVFTQVVKKRNPPKGYDDSSPHRLIGIVACSLTGYLAAGLNTSRDSRIDSCVWRIC